MTVGLQTPPTEEKKIEAPEWCVFRAGQIIPFYGYAWRVKGYTKDFDLVLKCDGPTSGKMKELKRLKKENQK